LACGWRPLICGDPCSAEHTEHTLLWRPASNLSPNAMHYSSCFFVCLKCVSDARCYDRITPVQKELHWLPVRHRVDFKIAYTLVYLSLSGMAPAYLYWPTVDCQLVSDEGRRQLRSANSRTCVVRRTYSSSSYGDRCFAAAGPKLWNSLPARLRQTDINFEQFK